MKGLLTKNEFNEIVDYCSKLTAKVYSYNRNKDNEGVQYPIVLALAFSTLCLFAYFFCIYYGIRDGNYGLRVAGYLLLAISVSLTCAIGFYNYF